MTFRFRCNSCGETHEGIPTFGADMPSIAQWISAADRPSRVDLGTDDCVVDGERFLVRGCLEIPVQGEADPFVWGVWRSEEHTSELQSLMRISYAVFCLKKKKQIRINSHIT